MVGYMEDANYRLWNPTDGPHGRIMRSRDVIFEEGAGHRTRDTPSEVQIESADQIDRDLPPNAAESVTSEKVEPSQPNPRPRATAVELPRRSSRIRQLTQRVCEAGGGGTTTWRSLGIR